MLNMTKNGRKKQKNHIFALTNDNNLVTLLTSTTNNTGLKMPFTPIDANTSTSGTFNVDELLVTHTQSLLLPDGRLERFTKLNESECFRFLGNAYDDFDNENGHTKEWYYTAPSGGLVGIAFRWGVPRLRGNGETKTLDVVEFVDFLQQTVKKCPHE